MSTIDQNELVRQAEQLNDAQWYDFLDALDEVAKRRRQRGSDIPDQPKDRSRDGVALWVALNHLAVDPSIREIWFLPQGPDDEIRLLEISERTESPGDEIIPFEFALDVEGAQFRLREADLTSDQFAQIRSGQLALPEGWSLEGARIAGRRGQLTTVPPPSSSGLDALYSVGRPVRNAAMPSPSIPADGNRNAREGLCLEECAATQDPSGPREIPEGARPRSSSAGRARLFR